MPVKSKTPAPKTGMGVPQKHYAYGPCPKPLRYSSASTRTQSLDGFAPGMIDATFPVLDSNIGDSDENLTVRLNSGTPYRDLPWSHRQPIVTRKIGVASFKLADEIGKFVRNAGQPPNGHK